jgi:hypothetical protein
MLTDISSSSESKVISRVKEPVLGIDTNSVKLLTTMVGIT